MSSLNTQHLHELFTIFDVARLGEGDPVAGVNLLAAKACSIANIQRPGSGLLASDGDTLAVGTSLMVSGSLTTSLISERVLTRLEIGLSCSAIQTTPNPPSPIC